MQEWVKDYPEFAELVEEFHRKEQARIKARHHVTE